uniref:Uncharacterized protein n=1 Tax=Cacopsylla melanoneura TaxID=428564 RepID=A0A8D8VS47_9HEMI
MTLSVPSASSSSTAAAGSIFCTTLTDILVEVTGSSDLSMDPAGVRDEGKEDSSRWVTGGSLWVSGESLLAATLEGVTLFFRAGTAAAVLDTTLATGSTTGAIEAALTTASCSTEVDVFFFFFFTGSSSASPPPKIVSRNPSPNAENPV